MGDRLCRVLSVFSGARNPRGGSASSASRSANWESSSAWCLRAASLDSSSKESLTARATDGSSSGSVTQKVSVGFGVGTAPGVGFGLGLGLAPAPAPFATPLGRPLGVGHGPGNPTHPFLRKEGQSASPYPSLTRFATASFVDPSPLAVRVPFFLSQLHGPARTARGLVLALAGDNRLTRMTWIRP